MRTPIIYVLSLLGLLFTACHQDDVQPIAPTDPIATWRATTRAGLPLESYSSSNPDLIFDWENQTEITLNTLGNDGLGEIVSAPWDQFMISTSLSDDFRMDIKREDGWTMLFHTFERTGKNRGLNYMCFYNLFTGYIKVFYYNETLTPVSNMVWSMIPGNMSFLSHSLFEIPDVLTPIDGEEILTSGNTVGVSITNAVNGNTLENGWNGFEFQVSRYEEFPSDLNISIKAFGQLVTDYNFNGISKSNIDGTIKSVISSDSNILNAVSQLGVDGTKKALEDLKGKILGENKEPTGYGKLLWDAAKSLAGDQIGDALKYGLKFLFGKSLWTETNYQVSDVRLTQSGTITVDGKSSTNVGVAVSPLTFNLYNMLIKRNNVNLGGSGEVVVSPDWDSSNFTGLGNWTVERYPIVYYNPVTRFVPTVVYEGSEWDVEGYAEFPAIEDYDLDIKFNPMVAPYILDYDVDVDFVETDLFNDNDDSSTCVSPGPNYMLTDHVYYMYPHQERLVMKVKMKNESFNRNLEWYYEWDDPGNRCTIAFVTVSMKVRYCGKEQTFCETRAYRTESQLAGGSFYPPYYPPVNMGLINNLDMRIISRSYLGDLPEGYKP